MENNRNRMWLKLSISIICILNCSLFVNASEIPTDEEISDCFKCAKEPTYHFCTQSNLRGGEYNVVCCSPDNEKGYCKKESESTNDCSQPYQDAPWEWYTHCPGITPKNCAGHQYLIPISEKQTWGHNYLRYQEGGIKWKKKQENKYDACWWSIHVPEYSWKTAVIKIKFIEISKGINIHLYGSKSKDAKELQTSIMGENDEPEEGVEYELDHLESMVVVAYPDKNSQDTKFYFEFWVEGVPYPIYEQYYNEYIVQNPNGEVMWIIVLVCAGTLGCIVVCCIAFCIKAVFRRCCGSKDRLKDDEKVSPYNAEGQLAFNKKHAHPDMAGMELESMVQSGVDGVPFHEQQTIDGDHKESPDVLRSPSFYDRQRSPRTQYVRGQSPAPLEFNYKNPFKMKKAKDQMP